MRRNLTSLTLIAASMLGAASVPVAVAQQPVAMYAANTRATHLGPIVRTVATYRLASARVPGMPAEVSIADSAGKLVATFKLGGSQIVRPMTVTVMGSDLVLQGTTPTGPLTLYLYGQNDAAPSGEINGQWWLGTQEGGLHGRLVR